MKDRFARIGKNLDKAIAALPSSEIVVGVEIEGADGCPRITVETVERMPRRRVETASGMRAVVVDDIHRTYELYTDVLSMLMMQRGN